MTIRYAGGRNPEEQRGIVLAASQPDGVPDQISVPHTPDGSDADTSLMTGANLQSNEVRPDANLSEADRLALKDLFDRPEMAAVWDQKDKVELCRLALHTVAYREFNEPLVDGIDRSFDKAVSDYAQWYTTGKTLRGVLNRTFRDMGGWHVAGEWGKRAARGTKEEAREVVEEAMTALADHLLALRTSLNEPPVAQLSAIPGAVTESADGTGESRLLARIARVSQGLRASEVIRSIIGKRPAMSDVRSKVARVAWDTAMGYYGEDPDLQPGEALPSRSYYAGALARAALGGNGALPQEEGRLTVGPVDGPEGPARRVSLGGRVADKISASADGQALLDSMDPVPDIGASWAVVAHWPADRVPDPKDYADRVLPGQPPAKLEGSSYVKNVWEYNTDGIRSKGWWGWLDSLSGSKNGGTTERLSYPTAVESDALARKRLEMLGYRRATSSDGTELPVSLTHGSSKKRLGRRPKS
ncbi:MAG TPA: hypothetical protein VGM08_04105 [Candidatus Saccharimonadales bacterium]|jgi:hypothetical protein